MLRAMISVFALIVVAGCQPSPPISTDRNSVVADAEINKSAALISPYGADLKGTGGGVVTVDGRILKVNIKFFQDDYFYAAVTPSVLNEPVQPLQLGKHSSWAEFLPDLRNRNSRTEGFVTDRDLADAVSAIKLVDQERAICEPRDLSIASPLASDVLEAAFAASVQYSPKADALAFVGKCVLTARES